MMKAVPAIALDADGVLLDYHAAYRQAWAKAFGNLPELRDPLAYWPMDRWNVHRLDLAERAQMRSYMGQEFWETLPAIPGALEACLLLKQAGYALFCISAVQAEYQDARLTNLTHSQHADLARFAKWWLSTH